MNPAVLGLEVLCLAVLVGLGSSILATFFTRREHEAHKEEVNRRILVVEQTVKSLDGKIAEVRKEIHDSELRLAEAGEHRAESLHNRFNESNERFTAVMTALGELRGSLNAKS